MRVVTGGDYPPDRWVVIDENGDVLFDPVFAFDNDNVKVCNVWVNMPKYRDALEGKFSDPDAN